VLPDLKYNAFWKHRYRTIKSVQLWLMLSDEHSDSLHLSLQKVAAPLTQLHCLLNNRKKALPVAMKHSKQKKFLVVFHDLLFMLL